MVAALAATCYPSSALTRQQRLAVACLMDRAFGRPAVAVQVDQTTREMALKKVIHEVRWLPPDPNDSSRTLAMRRRGAISSVLLCELRMRTRKIEPASGRGRLPPNDRLPRALVGVVRPVSLRSTSPDSRPPGFIEPCLPTPADLVPSGPQWVHEIKHDGYRFICRRDGDRVRVFNRRGNDYTDRVPAIAEALAALKVKSATIDGEGVVCGSDGVSDFGRLRSALKRDGSRRVFLYAFDLLELDGRDLRPRPWEDRRKALTKLLRKAGVGIQLCQHLAITDGDTIFRHACAMGLEGIVAKRRDKPYRSGRSPDWIKVKNPDAPAASRIMEW